MGVLVLIVKYQMLQKHGKDGDHCRPQKEQFPRSLLLSALTWLLLMNSDCPSIIADVVSLFPADSLADGCLFGR